MNNIVRNILLIFIIFYIIKNRMPLNSPRKLENKKIRKIINTHWHGRFGNRMFTYAYGCSYAKKNDCI